MSRSGSIPLRLFCPTGAALSRPEPFPTPSGDRSRAWRSSWTPKGNPIAGRSKQKAGESPVPEDLYREPARIFGSPPTGKRRRGAVCLSAARDAAPLIRLMEGERRPEGGLGETRRGRERGRGEDRLCGSGRTLPQKPQARRHAAQRTRRRKSRRRTDGRDPIKTAEAVPPVRIEPGEVAPHRHITKNDRASSHQVGEPSQFSGLSNRPRVDEHPLRNDRLRRVHHRRDRERDRVDRERTGRPVVPRAPEPAEG